MSKENLSNKSSINPPEEGIKNAKESNATQYLINENPDISQPQTQQSAQKKKRVLTDTKEMLGLRAATAAAGAVLVGAKVVSAVAKVRANLDVTGAVDDLRSASDIAKGLGKAAGPTDKLINQKGKIKEEGARSPGLVDKAIDKIKTLPGGEATANVLDKTYKTLISKPVLRAAKAGGAIISMVVNPTPVGIVAGALSLSAIGFNVVKETLEVREGRHLNVEKKILENIKENKERQLYRVLSAKENIAKNSPDLQKFLDNKIPDIYKNPPEPSPEKPFEGSKLRELAKAIRDSMLENASLMLEGIASGGIVGIVAATATGLINTGTEADSNLVRREQRNDKINKINNLKLTAGNYQALPRSS